MPSLGAHYSLDPGELLFSDGEADGSWLPPPDGLSVGEAEPVVGEPDCEGDGEPDDGDGDPD